MRSGEIAPCAAPCDAWCSAATAGTSWRTTQSAALISSSSPSRSATASTSDRRAPRGCSDTSASAVAALETIEAPHPCVAWMAELRETCNLLAQCRLEPGGQQLRGKAQLLEALAGAVADDEARAERIGERGGGRKGHDGCGLHGFLQRSVRARGVPAPRGGHQRCRATAVPGAAGGETRPNTPTSCVSGISQGGTPSAADGFVAAMTKASAASPARVAPGALWQRRDVRSRHEAASSGVIT